jgi:hypothetical protein
MPMWRRIATGEYVAVATHQATTRDTTHLAARGYCQGFPQKITGGNNDVSKRFCLFLQTLPDFR